MPTRPQLRPGLRRVWRDPTTMQVGLFPGPGVVLAGLRAGDEAVLSALDGAHDLDQVRQVAARHQVGRRRVDELLALLRQARLLVGEDPYRPLDRVHLTRLGQGARARLRPDTDAWSLVHDTDGLLLAAGRANRQVLVQGAGRVGSAIATTLSAAGVGAVSVRDARAVRPGDVLPTGAGAADVGGSWTQAMATALERVRGVPTSAAPSVTTPDLVVLVGEQVLDARVGDNLVRRDVPHLGVVVGSDRVVVGPLVLPGRSACLRCVDLHRRDRDPAWPHLVAQLLGRPVTTSGAGEAVGETALSTAAAGVAALQVLGQLDGQVQPDAVGRTLELTLPQGAVRRRAWRLHAGCGCARLPGRDELAPDEQARDDAPATVTGQPSLRPPAWTTMGP